MSNWEWNESKRKEYLALKKVYCRSLSENVIPKGLRLKKTPLIGEASAHFKTQWRKVKFEAERALLVVLKNEVGRKQIELRQNICRKTRHLMFTREDREEKSWLAELERYEHRWKEELAARRRKKFSKLLGNQAKRRRRALSKEAISDSRRYVTDCMEFNEEISRTSKNEGSVKNLEDLVSQRVGKR